MKGMSNIESCNSAYGQNRSDLSQKDFNRVKNADLFITLLEDKIKHFKASDKLSDASLPLNKQLLERLTDAVQRQMDDYLFRELSKFDEENDLPAFNRQCINFGRIGNLEASFISKIEHEPIKRIKIKPTSEINGIIEHASNIYDVDPALIRSVIRAESNYDCNATSSKGAMGLMQLMPETAKDLGVKNSYDPIENIMAGTRYLKSLLNRYDGNVELTLAAYNWGMGNVEKQPDRLPKETRTYIVRVNEYLRQETSYNQL